MGDLVTCRQKTLDWILEKVNGNGHLKEKAQWREKWREWCTLHRTCLWAETLSSNTPKLLHSHPLEMSVYHYVSFLR